MCVSRDHRHREERREEIRELRELQETRQELLQELEEVVERLTRLEERMRLRLHPELMAVQEAMLEDIKENLRELRENLGSDGDGEVEDEGNL